MGDSPSSIARTSPQLWFVRADIVEEGFAVDMALDKGIGRPGRNQ
jgi:hypothetical protein